VLSKNKSGKGFLAVTSDDALQRYAVKVGRGG